MRVVDSVKSIDRKMSKFFVPFSILFFGFIFGWKYASGETIFNSLLQDISILFILLNQGVIIGYLTWYRD